MAYNRQHHNDCLGEEIQEDDIILFCASNRYADLQAYRVLKVNDTHTLCVQQVDKDTLEVALTGYGQNKTPARKVTIENLNRCVRANFLKTRIEEKRYGIYEA